MEIIVIESRKILVPEDTKTVQVKRYSTEDIYEETGIEWAPVQTIVHSEDDKIGRLNVAVSQETKHVLRLKERNYNELQIEYKKLQKSFDQTTKTIDRLFDDKTKLIKKIRKLKTRNLWQRIINKS